MASNSNLHRVRLEIPGTQILSRLFIDDRELRGVRRIWFELGQGRGPFGDRQWGAPPTIHVEFYAQDLIVEGDAELDLTEVRPQRTHTP
jgi:hypothetical protein